MTGPSPDADNMTQGTDPSKLKDCDLVMKGGITSGVLYPPVIQQIIGDYRFRGIGGTSVGAMAAVVIAAAEFYRQQSQHQGSTASFDCLNKDVRKWLIAPGNILRLFQPTRQTRPLLSFALALQPNPKDTSTQDLNTQSTTPPTNQPAPSAPALTAKFLQAWLFHYPLAFSGSALLGTIIGFLLSAIVTLAIFALFSLFTHTSVALNAWAYLTLLGALLGWQTGNIVGAIAYLPKNFYGLCTGYTPTPQERTQAAVLVPRVNDPAASQTSAGKPDPAMPATNSQEAITFQPGTQYTTLAAWLDHLITCLAGKSTDALLTMKDLAKQGITLKMVTTNLSLTLPYVMPGDLRNFIFNAQEMVEFFPLHVVQYMIDNQPGINNPDPSKRPLIAPQDLPDHYFFLPEPDDLPVVLCARMSMSFPVLLSAVKLYAIDRGAYDRYKTRPGKLAPGDLNANWFSDGGICSNFPIHFFDAWLPSYPTFGINLLSKEKITTCVTVNDQEETASSNEGSALKGILKEPDTDGDVFIRRADDRPDPEWHKVEGLLGFGSAIFGAAQNYHDMLQTNLPSYRERIAQIRLSDDEGGLNLNMSGTTIKTIISKGEKAGNLLEAFNFDQHVWVRFLLLMALLEQHVSEIEADDLTLIAKILKDGKVPDGYPFDKDSQWLENAKPRFITLLTFVESWNSQFKDIAQDEQGQHQAKPSTFFQRSIPLAGSGLHVRPKI